MSAKKKTRRRISKAELDQLKKYARELRTTAAKLRDQSERLKKRTRP